MTPREIIERGPARRKLCGAPEARIRYVDAETAARYALFCENFLPERKRALRRANRGYRRRNGLTLRNA